VSVVRLRRLVLALGALLVSAPLVYAALPKHTLAPEDASLAGRLLIAATTMGDPRFRQTVILIARHNKDGAFGITINRPVGERSLASLLEKPGEKTEPVPGSIVIFAGGPVETQSGFIVHTTDYSKAGTLEINKQFAVTTSPNILRDIANNKGPQRSLVAFGYAGWAPGQLEAELARNDWLTTTADISLVFEERRERVWDAAMARQSRDQ
jgi:putative transcriptional regulator